MIHLILTLLLTRPVRVTWMGYSRAITVCESDTPKLNEYTGQYDFPTTVSSVACWRTSSSFMSKEFDSVIEAMDFIAKAPRCDAGHFTSCADGFIISTLPEYDAVSTKWLSTKGSELPGFETGVDTEHK